MFTPTFHLFASISDKFAEAFGFKVLHIFAGLASRALLALQQSIVKRARSEEIAPHLADGLQLHLGIAKLVEDIQVALKAMPDLLEAVAREKVLEQLNRGEKAARFDAQPMNRFFGDVAPASLQALAVAFG